AGAALLTVLAWIVFRLSMRLPLRQFFSVSGLLMFILSLVFAGKGVAALQEAGYIYVTPVNMPRVDLLGIYPNLQGLLLQGTLLLLALFLWYGLPGRRRSGADT
ncbi:MAG: iron permease, partial [Gammaproteobacteria bacterium]